MGDKVKKIQAFKELLKIAQSGALHLYQSPYDCNSLVSISQQNNTTTQEEKIIPIEWEKPLGSGQYKSEEDRQFALDNALERIVLADFPPSIEQMDKERRLVRLLLDAGADPNRSFDSTRRIFDAFWVIKGKSYAAVEIVKTKGFTQPLKSEKAYECLLRTLSFYLENKKPRLGTTVEESARFAQNCTDRKELVYLLFKKNIYPKDQKVFEKLLPVVLEKDPEFFNRKKQQTILQMHRAKTPMQIFNALMGKRKEKN